MEYIINGSVAADREIWKKWFVSKGNRLVIVIVRKYITPASAHEISA